MSISDQIVVMREGVLMQQGAPQEVYDNPQNLFVAKFLGTPPINIFDGRVEKGFLFLGDQKALAVPGAPDGKVLVGIRPEGFEPDEKGPVICGLSRVEVLGRDTSMVCTHAACQKDSLRAIVPSAGEISAAADSVRFALRPEKVFLFHCQSQHRIPFDRAAV